MAMKYWEEKKIEEQVIQAVHVSNSSGFIPVEMFAWGRTYPLAM